MNGLAVPDKSDLYKMGIAAFTASLGLSRRYIVCDGGIYEQAFALKGSFLSKYIP